MGEKLKSCSHLKVMEGSWGQVCEVNPQSWTGSLHLQVAPFEGKASLTSSCNSWVTAGNSAIKWLNIIKSTKSIDLDRHPSRFNGNPKPSILVLVEKEVLGNRER